MKLTVGKVMDATIVLTTIINEKRSMPQKGKFLLARLHARLLPEYNLGNAQRDAMIKSYDTLATEDVIDGATGEVRQVPKMDAKWIVPLEKLEEFNTAWKTIADEEIDIDVEPVSIRQLDMCDGSNGSIEAHELITLGELVTD